MALKIRMSRGGAKRRPFYRIVVADSRKPRDGRFIERLGTYDPMLDRDNPDRVKLNEERIKHWLSQGAQPSDRVARFLGAAKLAPIPSVPEQTKKNQPKAKAQERLREAEEAKQAAEEAAKAAAEQAASEPEADVAAEEQDGEPSKSTEGSGEEVVADSDESENKEE